MNKEKAATNNVTLGGDVNLSLVLKCFDLNAFFKGHVHNLSVI